MCVVVTGTLVAQPPPPLGGAQAPEDQVDRATHAGAMRADEDSAGVAGAGEAPWNVRVDEAAIGMIAYLYEARIRRRVWETHSAGGNVHPNHLEPAQPESVQPLQHEPTEQVSMQQAPVHPMQPGPGSGHNSVARPDAAATVGGALQTPPSHSSRDESGGDGT